MTGRPPTFQSRAADFEIFGYLMSDGSINAEAKAFAHPKEQQRRAAQQAWEQRLLAIGRPFLG